MAARLTAAKSGILQQTQDPPQGVWFAESAMAAVSLAIGFDGYCLFGVDPLTGIRSVMFSRHGVTAATERLLHNETVDNDANRYENLVRGSRNAGVLSKHESGGGSPRLHELLRPDGYTSELRLALVTGGHYWGALNLFRSDARHPFTQEDADAAQELSAPLSLAIRRYQLGGSATTATRRDSGVVLFDQRGSVMTANGAARSWLMSLADSWADGALYTDVDRVVHEVAAVAAGRRPGIPLCRVRMPDGEWLVVSGSKLGDGDGDGHHDGEVDVAVVLRTGDVHTVAPAFAAWCGLTARETQVLELLASGLSAKHMARALSLSVMTLNDHLRAIYRKASVRGRDELLALLC
jgi:DNA-binding CsgD family transcriptional regulator